MRVDLAELGVLIQELEEKALHLEIRVEKNGVYFHLENVDEILDLLVFVLQILLVLALLVERVVLVLDDGGDFVVVILNQRVRLFKL